MGDFPWLIMSIFTWAMSTPTMSWPRADRHPAQTAPTYPNPKILMRIARPPGLMANPDLASKVRASNSYMTRRHGRILGGKLQGKLDRNLKAQQP
ncbi:hypothetical protein D9M70_650640 [compost metagenome]